jgi:hypothetical protein
MRDLKGLDRFRVISGDILTFWDPFGFCWRRLNEFEDVWVNSHGELTTILNTNDLIYGRSEEFISELSEILGNRVLIIENEPLRDVYKVHVMKVTRVNFPLGMSDGVLLSSDTSIYSFYRIYSIYEYMKNFKFYPNIGNNLDGTSEFILRRSSLLGLIDIDDCYEEVLECLSGKIPFRLDLRFRDYNIEEYKVW